MAKFRIGQRVKAVADDHRQHDIIGREGTVTHLGPLVNGDKEVFDYGVLFDGFQHSLLANEHELEPLTKPGTFTLESELSRIFGHEVSIESDFQPRPRVSA